MTTERDEALHERERLHDVGDPYLHPPDEVELEEGMACWRDERRICGTDCVAFNLATLDERGQPTNVPEQCVLLDVKLKSLQAQQQLLQLERDKVRQANSSHPFGGSR